MSKRILITGCTGLIGTHTIEHYLTTTSWHLVLICSLKNFGDSTLIQQLEGYDPSRITMLWHDLNADVHDMLIQAMGDIDVIINIASLTEVEDSITNPVSFIQTNTNLVLNVLELARKIKPAMFIQVSTNEVYGPTPIGQAFDEFSMHKPSNPYAASKGVQEMICFSYWRTFDLPLVITNTMNNFGEHQASHKFLPSTVRKVRAGQPNIVHASKINGEWVSGSRVWLHAKNHADANKFIIENVKPTEFKQGILEPDRFNIAGDESLSNQQIVEMVADILNAECHIEHLDFHSSRPGHDLHYALDNKKLKNMGWRPVISTRESFERAVAWYASR